MIPRDPITWDRTPTAAALALAAALVAVPAAARDAEPVWEANAVRLETRDLGAGAFALIPDDADEKAPAGLPVATSSGFVVGRDAVLVVDTGINERVAGQILDAVDEHAPGRRLYAVNTSFHGDHSYGNEHLPQDAVIVQHVVTRAYLDDHFEEDVAFMLGLFGEGLGIEDADYRQADLLLHEGGTLALDLGGVWVEVRGFGFAQTGGDLWVWVPAARVLYAGNAVIAEPPSLPWLLDGHAAETRETLARVRDFLPEDAVIVPGHGRPVGVDALDWHIGYLDALIAAAEDTAARGLDEAAFAEEAALPEFEGYALFDWVHLQLNAPTALREAIGSRP